jgi:hypothetical protein
MHKADDKPISLVFAKICCMKKIVLSCALLTSLCAYRGLAQQAPVTYADWTAKADELFSARKYEEAGEAFGKAFAANNGKGSVNDRYNAACAWAKAGKKDSAFVQLDRIAGKGKYSEINQLATDDDLTALHNDKRWKELCATVRTNKQQAEAHLNKPLVTVLDAIFTKDQANRQRIDGIEKRYGNESKEMRDLWTTINHDDSLNLIAVTALIDKYGWPGADVAGQQGNETVFLVIQHGDLKTQQKYLPVMREAVKQHSAEASSLALLEDRVALREGRKQIYGSQIHGGPNGDKWISPLEDPDNVDKRRKEVGLEPLADYVRQWNIKWDVAEYKKQLPEIEKKDKW